MARTFAGFMSYVLLDDRHENGRLTELCSRLSGEVRMQLGEQFSIFQDRNDVSWGQQWQQRIDGVIDETTFLIPIITPGFFRSPACRGEVERFLKRENDLGRSDLILPIYYVNCPILSDETQRNGDSIAQSIAARQHFDWRELRFESFTSPAVGKTLAALAGHIVRALEDVRPERSAVSEIAPTMGADSQLTGEDEGGKNRASSVVKGQRSGDGKNDPPTLIVDALHRGDYSSLTKALEAAQSGYRILIRPGLYREGIVIDKAIEIIGDGEPGEIVIEAVGTPVIRFRANMGRAVNLTLRQLGGDGKWFGVDIGQGRLDLEGCDITSASLAGVAIYGGADPRLRRNRIHDCKQSGVFIYQNGLGTLEDNEIFSNTQSGVAIKSGGNPTLRRNRIGDGKQGGVYVYENGLGTLEDNEIFGNTLAGIEVKSGGNPTLRRNRIHGGKQMGVFVQDGGLGVLEDNEIFSNVLAGVGIKSGANPTLRRNRIYDSRQSGVVVYEDGLGILEENDVFGNERSGITIASRGNPTVRRNRIHDGKQGGVFVYENGRGMLEYNEIFGNKRAGVKVVSGGNPTLRWNIITKNGYEAVWIVDGGSAEITDNDLRGNIRGAFDISGDCKEAVKLERNKAQ